MVDVSVFELCNIKRKRSTQSYLSRKSFLCSDSLASGTICVCWHWNRIPVRFKRTQRMVFLFLMSRPAFPPSISMWLISWVASKCDVKMSRRRSSLPREGVTSYWTVLTSRFGSRRRTIIIPTHKCHARQLKLQKTTNHLILITIPIISRRSGCAARIKLT